MVMADDRVNDPQRYEKLPRVNTTYENAHEVIKGDPRIDGPYLDEVRAREADNLRKWREQAFNEHKDDFSKAPDSETAEDEQAKAKATAQRVKEVKKSEDKPVAKKAAAKKAPAKKAVNK
jgi:HSP90 family molecular chaperone